MTATCPACQSPRIVAVAEHYQTQIRLPEADLEALAALAPPLRRTVLSGTLCITAFWMAILSPGFTEGRHALYASATFAALGAIALAYWLRARKTDRIRQSAYQSQRLCLDCAHRF
jgi:peptidoglycan/LPS O-acetylase OafA/YrhL